MTRSARHRETTISMIDSNALLNDRLNSLTQREYASSRRVAVQQRREHKSDSGACYMGGKNVRLFRHDTGVGIARPQLVLSTDSHINEKSAIPGPLSDRDARLPSRSSSTISRFVDRLGTSVNSLSSLHTIPSWRNTFPRAHNTYAKIERGHDVSGCSGSDSPSLPRLRGEASPSQHSSSGYLRNNSLRHRRRHTANRPGSRSNVPHAPISDLLTRFSHAMTTSTGGQRGSGTSSSYSSSLGTHRSYSDSSHIPFPSISDESYRTFPTPYSDDAAALFQAPLNKSDVPHVFDGHVKFRGVYEDHMQVVFEEGTDRTSSSASTSTGATSVRTASKPPSLLIRSRRRASALARAVTPARCKFPTIFDKKRHRPRPAYDDHDPVEYDIPCLAYVTCLW